MSSFFSQPASQRKRKRNDSAPARAPKRRDLKGPPTKSVPKKSSKHARAEEDDVSISGSDSDDEGAKDSFFEDADSESDVGSETEADKRRRLAERYLDNVKAEISKDQDVGFNAEDIDRELIAARLKEDVAEDKGRIYRFISEQLDYAAASHTLFRANTKATTAVAVCPPYVYTASKDRTLIKWELQMPPHGQRREARPQVNGDTRPPPPPKRKPKQLAYTVGQKKFSKMETEQHHTQAILCLAASADGKYVISGGMDRRIIVWDAATMRPLKVFPQHRDSITGLAFRGKTNQLFSASRDRTIKIFHIDELAYVETLFGHQDEVVDVAAVGGSQERCVSVGARDRSARIWKVVEESQLVFRGGGTGVKRPKSKEKPCSAKGEAAVEDEDETPVFAEGSLDRVIQLDTQLFVTGSDSGALSLFGLHKKKALHVYPMAHGYDPPISVEQSSAEKDLTKAKTQGKPTARWITALACVPYSDLFVSGSWDGFVRVWRVNNDTKKIEPLGVLGGGEEGPAGILTNGHTPSPDQHGDGRLRGIINDLKVFERGDRGADGACVVAAIGDEPRLGNWLTKKCKTGAVVFEIPRRVAEKPATNGVSTTVASDDDED